MRTDRPKLPRPDINVTTTSDGAANDLVISRDGKAKSYRIEGTTRQDVIKDAVKKVLDDPRSAEWLP